MPSYFRDIDKYGDQRQIFCKCVKRSVFPSGRARCRLLRTNGSIISIFPMPFSLKSLQRQGACAVQVKKWPFILFYRFTLEFDDFASFWKTFSDDLFLRSQRHARQEMSADPVVLEVLVVSQQLLALLLEAARSQFLKPLLSSGRSVQESR